MIKEKNDLFTILLELRNDRINAIIAYFIILMFRNYTHKPTYCHTL